MPAKRTTAKTSAAKPAAAKRTAAKPASRKSAVSTAKPAAPRHRVFAMSFASVYPHYIAKAEKKGRTKAEVDEIILWLTGYTAREFAKHLKDGTDFEAFYGQARLNPARTLITGTVCGMRHRGPAHARAALPRQAHRRAREGQGDGEDSAEG
jgi:hypothetical protein